MSSEVQSNNNYTAIRLANPCIWNKISVYRRIANVNSKEKSTRFVEKR